MYRLLLLSLLGIVALASPSVSEAARGFGATVGSGTTDIITTGAIASSTSRSLCLWFNTRAVDATNAARMVNQVGAGGTITDISQNTTTNLRFVVGWVTQDGSWNVAEPSTGTYHHLCVTYNGSATTNDPIFYLDGATPAVTEAAVPIGSPVDSGTEVYNFGNIAALNRVFDGSIAEVAGWSSVLSAGNIASLYNSGSGARADSIGVAPVFYFTLCGNASPETDEMGGTAATVSGALVTTHPFSNCAVAAPVRSTGCGAALILLGKGAGC